MAGKRLLSSALLEPFMTGSHRQWVETVQRHSAHEIIPFTLPGRFWKWRMHGGAVELAKAFLESGCRPDIILATDMLDLTTFLALTRKRTADVPAYLYFHENQLTYPWSEDDPDIRSGRDNHYAFINYVSALAADHILFNSAYHRDSFLGALPAFLSQFPDYEGLSGMGELMAKSTVFPLMLDLTGFDRWKTPKMNNQPCTFLWNHRWEYDKNPGGFFRLMYGIQDIGLDFRLIVLGEKFGEAPPVFEEARTRLGDKITHWGYAGEFEEYARLLWEADILPVTSQQDYFGASIMEAVYCETMPLLPNRLAYPGHIPLEARDKYLYSGEGELLERCVEAIRSVELVRSGTYREIAARYNAERLAGQFDSLFFASLHNNSQS